MLNGGFIPQETSALVQARLGLSEEGTALVPSIPRAPSAATREARYLEVMKRLQFGEFKSNFLVVNQDTICHLV